MRLMLGIAVLILLSAILLPAEAADGKVDVVVTINVLEDIVKQVGGEHVTVKSLVTGLENPHTYSTTPEDRRAVENCDLFVEIGMGLEPWAGDLTVDVSKEKILVASDNCTKIGENPHVWMDPENGKTIATEIEKRLERTDPNNAGYFRERLHNYLDLLNSTESRIEQFGRSVENKGVITSTPAFSYLLKRMNTTEVDTVIKGPGKQPSTDEIMRIEDEINSGKASVIIDFAQINIPVIGQIASDTGATVVTGTALLGVLGIDTYENLLLYNAQAIFTGLEKAEMQKEINRLHSRIDSINAEMTMIFLGFLALLALSVAEGYEIWRVRRGEW